MSKATDLPTEAIWDNSEIQSYWQEEISKLGELNDYQARRFAREIASYLVPMTLRFVAGKQIDEVNEADLLKCISLTALSPLDNGYYGNLHLALKEVKSVKGYAIIEYNKILSVSLGEDLEAAGVALDSLEFAGEILYKLKRALLLKPGCEDHAASAAIHYAYMVHSFSPAVTETKRSVRDSALEDVCKILKASLLT